MRFTLDETHGGESNERSTPDYDVALPTLYEELRKLATASMRKERRGHTLQATALANEAFLRLAAQESFRGLDERQFRSLAARVIRRVLVDHARARQRQRRGGGGLRVELSDDLALIEHREIEVLSIHAALEDLAAVDERQARVVELRFFGGLSLDEIAEELRVSRRTINEDLRMARAWLHRSLAREGKDERQGGSSSVRK
jgi:RNA polymerase sigma factor (TIGR02999 family)